MKCSSKPEDWITEDKLTLLRAWARDGMINTEIIKKMDISENTLYLWKNKYPQIEEALRQGKEVVDIQVENALLQRALGYTKRVLKQKLTKDGDIIDVYEDIHIPADTTAQIFWLKNRRPKFWRDKREIDNNVKIDDGKESFKALSTEELKKLAGE